MNVTLILEPAPWVPVKNLNIEYYPKEETTPPPTDSGGNDDIKPSGICDGEIEWTENATHRVVTGYNGKGNAYIVIASILLHTKQL